MTQGAISSPTFEASVPYKQFVLASCNMNNLQGQFSIVLQTVAIPQVCTSFPGLPGQNAPVVPMLRLVIDTINNMLALTDGND